MLSYGGNVPLLKKGDVFDILHKVIQHNFTETVNEYSAEHYVIEGELVFHGVIFFINGKEHHRVPKWNETYTLESFMTWIFKRELGLFNAS